MPLDQNLHQTVTRFGCVGFSMYACEFPVPQMRQFSLFTYPLRSKWASSEKMIFFFAKVGIFCKSIAGPLSEAKTYWVVNWLQLLNQLSFVWLWRQGLYAKFVSIMSRKCSIIENDDKLMLRALHPYFLPQKQYSLCVGFGFSRFGLIDKVATFLYFFHKITNIRNPYAIFARILQHYDDFQNNVGIFPNVVQAYTQPYSFGGRIKLIICQIRQELSVTIHVISISWKNNLRWRTH